MPWPRAQFYRLKYRSEIGFSRHYAQHTIGSSLMSGSPTTPCCFHSGCVARSCHRRSCCGHSTIPSCRSRSYRGHSWNPSCRSRSCCGRSWNPSCRSRSWCCGHSTIPSCRSRMSSRHRSSPNLKSPYSRCQTNLSCRAHSRNPSCRSRMCPQYSRSHYYCRSSRPERSHSHSARTRRPEGLTLRDPWRHTLAILLLA
jgi:hypothetical protein